MSTLLNVTTALQTFVLAEQHQCSNLKEACLRFIVSRKNYIAVMATDDVEHLMRSDPSVFHKVITQILVEREKTPRWQLSYRRAIFYMIVSIVILTLDSVDILRITSIGLMMLLLFVLHRG